MLKKNILLISFIFISLLILPSTLAYFEENTTRFKFPPNLLIEESGQDLKEIQIIRNDELQQYYVLYRKGGDDINIFASAYYLDKYDNSWNLIERAYSFDSKSWGAHLENEYRPYDCEMGADWNNQSLYVACSFGRQSDWVTHTYWRHILVWIFDMALDVKLPSRNCGGAGIFDGCQIIDSDNIGTGASWSAVGEATRMYDKVSISNVGWASSSRDTSGIFISWYPKTGGGESSINWRRAIENPKFSFVVENIQVQADLLQTWDMEGVQDIHNTDDSKEYIIYTGNVNQPSLVGHYYLYANVYRHAWDEYPWYCYIPYLWCTEYEERKNLITDEEVYDFTIIKEQYDNVYYAMYRTTGNVWKIASFTGDWVLVHKETLQMSDDFGYPYTNVQSISGIDGTCRNQTLTKPWIALEYRHGAGSGYGGRWGYEIWYPDNTSCSGTGKHCGLVFSFTSGSLVYYPPHCAKITGNASQFWDSPNSMFFKWCTSCSGGCTMGGEIRKWAWTTNVVNARIHIWGDMFWIPFSANLGKDITCTGECYGCSEGRYKIFLSMQNVSCECTPWVKGECYAGQYRRYSRACRPLILGEPCNEEEKFEEDPTCIIACPPEWKCYDPAYLCWYNEECEWELDMCYYCTYGCNFTEPNSCYGITPTTTVPTYCSEPCPPYMKQYPAPDCSCYCENSCLTYKPDSCECAQLTINTSEWRENPVQVFADISEGLMVMVGIIAIPLAVILLALGFASIIFLIMAKAVPKP